MIMSSGTFPMLLHSFASLRKAREASAKPSKGMVTVRRPLTDPNVGLMALPCPTSLLSRDVLNLSQCVCSVGPVERGRRRLS
jgi:hypothetical protein